MINIRESNAKSPPVGCFYLTLLDSPRLNGNMQTTLFKSMHFKEQLQKCRLFFVTFELITDEIIQIIMKFNVYVHAKHLYNYISTKNTCMPNAAPGNLRLPDFTGMLKK